MPDDDTLDPVMEEQLGRRVTLRGKARNALGGALVVPFGCIPVYVGGLAAWGRAVAGKRVEVTGVLRRRALDSPPHQVSAGGDGGTLDEVYVIDDAEWTLRFF